MKKTQGRKKIEMQKIKDRGSLQVTFSKRRAGVFKKASELCVLSGAEAAVIVESPGKRVYAFGHPSVDSVVDQYVAGISSSAPPPEHAPAPAPPPIINQVDASNSDRLNQEYLEITKEMEDEKRKKKVDVMENKAAEDGPPNWWWEQPFDHLGVQELEEYIASMETLKNKVIARANEMQMNRNSSMFDASQSSKNDKLLVPKNGNGSPSRI